MPKSEREIITFRLESHIKDALDEVALSIQRDRSFVLSEAITLYLDVHRWQLEDVQKAITEADAGKFASDKQVVATFAEWLPDANTMA
jgi:predicted transcriptional regulator